MSHVCRWCDEFAARLMVCYVSTQRMHLLVYFIAVAPPQLQIWHWECSIICATTPTHVHVHTSPSCVQMISTCLYSQYDNFKFCCKVHVLLQSYYKAALTGCACAILRRLAVIPRTVRNAYRVLGNGKKSRGGHLKSRPTVYCVPYL